MSTMTLFDTTYERRKEALLRQVLQRLKPIYSSEDLEALQIDPIDPAILSQRSGRGFVNRDILETVLGNLLECVAPGSHNALDSRYQKREVGAVVEEMADQLYAMIAQSLLAAGEEKEVEDRALLASFALLWEMPGLKERARWNRFASLKDPAVWDAYLLHRCGLSDAELSRLEFGTQIEAAIEERDLDRYRRFLATLDCEFTFAYQMQLVMSTYPGWRVLFYHDIAHALTRSGEVEDNPRLRYTPRTPSAPCHRRAGRALLPGRPAPRDPHRRRQFPRSPPPRHHHRADRDHRQGVPSAALHHGRIEREATAAPSRYR